MDFSMMMNKSIKIDRQQFSEKSVCLRGFKKEIY